MNVLKKTFLELGGVVLIGILLFAGANVFYGNDDVTNQQEEVSEDVKVRINNSYLVLEVADNDVSRALGLMNREYLSQDRGMIFVYDEESVQYFWMKNVLIPLDMIFVDADLEIVGIINDVPICIQEPCPTYSVEQASKYVIEVNAGWVFQNNVKVGDRVDFIMEHLSDS